MRRLKQVQNDWHIFHRMPSVTINLMLRAAKENDPFYERLVLQFYSETRRRHRRFPLIRHWKYGVSLCELPDTFDDYFMLLESSARRNVRKAVRQGYRFERIKHNDWLDAMQAIHASTGIRQGEMPEELLHGSVKPNDDPPSKTNVHDYPYFGVLKDDRLTAYAGCFVAGEVMMIEQIYGHADHHSNGVVPLLLSKMADYALQHYPHVRYYTYEMFFGSTPTLRRFKKKFKFLPHKVEWKL